MFKTLTFAFTSVLSDFYVPFVRSGKVCLAHHSAAVGEYDPSLRGNGQALLSG